MVYTEPIRSKNNNSRRKKRLTIGNTDRFKNYNSITNEELNSMVVINANNILSIRDSVAKKYNAGKVDNNIYRYDKVYEFAVERASENVLLDLLDMGINLVYHVQVGEVTDKMLDALARSAGDTAILYTLHDKNMHVEKGIKIIDKVNNVMKAHEATKVIFDTALVLPDMSGVDIIKAFEPYATNINEIQIDIPALTTKEIEYGKDTNSFMVDMRKQYYILKTDGLWYCSPKSKYTIYKSIKRAFSDWGTMITMVCKDKAEKRALDKLVESNK